MQRSRIPPRQSPRLGQGLGWKLSGDLEFADFTKRTGERMWGLGHLGWRFEV